MITPRYRHHFHLLPPAGWLNDPNGSCWWGDRCHIFFQYAPDSPHGSGSKCWGHYTSRDLIRWDYEGIAVAPDSPYDCSGAYSGTAYTGSGSLELFYTGNVKHPGNYDYINEGRGHNVLYLKSADGLSFSPKEVLLTNEDYPAAMSCHVRDPKVWQADGCCYLLLGARTRDSQAALLLYRSSDRKHWTLARDIRPEAPFGYMLECPDYFSCGESEVLAFCPQGIPQGTEKFQNIYSSGYLILPEGTLTDAPSDALNKCLLPDRFQEWDQGFDFYAPQTFSLPDGRRVLIGWAGVPDAPYDNLPAVAEGWQHSLTLLRELTVTPDRILQYPIRELEALRQAPVSCPLEKQTVLTPGFSFDLELERRPALAQQAFTLRFSSDLLLTFAEGMLSLRFLNNTGRGRTIRHGVCPQVRELRILMDASLLEIYVNRGTLVFTTRWYPGNARGVLLASDGGFTGTLWPMADSIRCDAPLPHNG